MEYHSGGSLPLLGRPRYCPGANANGGYLCETGHCCGESGCCTYYYELWWFWLLWTVLILFSCCCAYRHRRAKLRVQQQQRQRDISLLAYQGASSFPSSMLDLSFLASLKLPSYEEVAAQPSTPPPPYSSVFTAPRYPQPPRIAHPHLLSQHPGGPQHPGALHRPLQPLSDGPSSLSSDNSSSCSCDSCCPSSPCSSSLSAPVTYETDTSHASTPSEATPLALDPVAMETISAAAARLDPAAVAIFIERNAGSASPSETKASPDLDAAFPVGITAPIKQQLDVTPTLQSTEHCASPDARTLDTSSKQPRTLSLILDSVGGNTDKNPSLVPISVSPQNPPRAAFSDETHTSQTESKRPKKSPSTSPAPRTVQSTDTDLSSPSQGIAHFLTKPADLTAEAPNVTTEREETGYVLKSPSIMLETTTEDTKNLRDVFGLSKQTCELSESTEMVASNSDQSNEKADTANSSLLETSQTQTSSQLSQNPKSEATASSLIPVTPSESISISMPDPLSSECSTISSSQAATDERKGTSSPESVSASLQLYTEIPLLTQDPSAQPTTEANSSAAEAVSPTFDGEAERMSVMNSDVEQNPVHSSDPSTSFPAITIQTDHPALVSVISATFDGETGKLSITNFEVEEKPSDLEHTSCLEVPPLTPDPGAQPTTKANSFAADGALPTETKAAESENSNPSNVNSCPPSFANVISPTVDRETGRTSATNLEVVQRPADSELLVLENSLTDSADASSFFPAITIHADPPSFATSPCSIPSPSSGAMLLLDPLAALQSSEKSAASSGHASSLSPSPRNTQSPPKQTLFSPCVDVFEPVNPSWEDDESEEQADEEYCEDSDVAADESQYRHRRLTGDSGIEVCRCRVEDEEEEEEEMEKAKKQDGEEKKSELHDSVDCPVRSRKSSSGDDGLCGTDTSSETVVIPVETA